MLARLIWYAAILCLLLGSAGARAQDTPSETEAVPSGEATEAVPADINGSWITQAGNLVELEVDGTSVKLYFPEFARVMWATYSGNVLVYITHYNDPGKEECYLDAPESERAACEGFVQEGDPRHRFTLTLSEDGMVLAGTKEINVLHCEWDVDENGNSYNHRPAGYTWTYYSDYRWRRANCDFTGLPPLNGNVFEKYELIGLLFDRFGLMLEFSLGDFVPRERIRFEYAQCYLDADTGVFVPYDEASAHQHLEPLDGSVYLDQDSGQYMIKLYPYAFRSYVTLLTGLTMMCHQYDAVLDTDPPLQIPTTRMEIDSVDYAWSHRQALCSTEDELFDHHIDFLSRALQLRAMAER